MQKLAWTFDLLDRMSGPARRIDQTMGRLQTTFKKVQGAAGGNAMDRFSKGFSGLSKSAGAGFSSIASVGSALAGPALAIGAVAVGLGAAGGKFMLDSLVFKENTLSSLESILGSKQAAEDLFKKATKFAQVTPFKTSEVVTAFEKLSAAGFKDDQLETLMKGVGDLGIGDTDKMNRAIMAISQIKAKGKMQGEELMQLAEMGVPMGKVFENLAKSMGKTTDQVQALMSAGKIKSDEGIAAVMETIRTTLSGGELGGKMDKASRSLSGLWSTLTSAPEDIIFGLGDSMAVMIEPIKGFVKKAIDLMGPDAPVGKALGQVFVKVGDIIGKAFAVVGSIDFAKWIDRIVDVAKDAWPKIEKFFEGFSKGFSIADVGKSLSKIIEAISDRIKSMDPAMLEKLGTTIGYIAFGFLKLIEYTIRFGAVVATVIDGVLSYIFAGWTMVAGFVDGLAGELETTPSRMFEIGLQLIAGFLGGMTSGFPGVFGAIDALGDGVIGKMVGKLGIASPSTVFAEIGRMTGLGFLEGLDGSGMNAKIADPLNPAAAGGTAALPGAPAPGAQFTGAALQPGATANGAPVITIGEVHVVVQVQDASDPKAIGAAASSGLKSQLASELSKLGLGFGG